MDLDQILVQIGPFGRYQKLFVIPVSISAGFSVFVMLISIFTQHTPKFRCASPWLPNDTYAIQNDLHKSIVNKSIPLDYTNGIWSLSKLRVYERLQNSSLVSNETLSCDRWVYDQSIFTKTLITEFNLVDEQGVYLHAVIGLGLMTGLLVGSYLSGYLSDRFGRRKTLALGYFFTAATGVCVGLSPNVISIIVFSFLNGVACPLIFLTGFVYGLEFTGMPKRVFCEMLGSYIWCFANMLLVLFSYLIRDWRHLQMAGSSTFLVFLILVPIIPETPRWLIGKGKLIEAERILRQAAVRNKRTLPAHIFKDILNRSEVKTEKFMKLFKSNTLAIRTLIIYFTWFAAAMAYYGLSLNVGNFHGNIFINVLISAFIELPSTIFCHVTLDRLGRKKLQIGGFLLAGVSLFAACITVVFFTDIKWLPMFLSMVGKYGVCVSFNTVYIYSGELFPTVVRNTGVGTSSMFSRIGVMLSPVMVTMGKLHPGYFESVFPLAVFGLSSLLAGILSIALPETMEVPIPETFEDALNIGKRMQKFTSKHGNFTSSSS